MKALPLADLIHIVNWFHRAYVDRYTKPDEFRKNVKTGCELIKAMCTYIGSTDDLIFQIEQVSSFAESERDLISDNNLFVLSLSLLYSVINTFDRPRFKVIPPNKVDYFEQPRQLFGELVIARFRPIELDVEEAGRCYATDRNTACVFHLMRVMEIGLRALGKSLNDARYDPKRNPSWEAILKKCDEELAKALKDRSIEWRQEDTFYSIATANLRAVKDAWRNPTMHVEQTYTEETALDVWFAVRAFMRHLSSKLSAE